MNDYLAAILFFLPAGIANISPVFANRLPGLKRWETPMDFGVHWHGKRLFGPNKRLRGLAFGTLMAGLTAVVVAHLYPNVVVSKHTFLIGCGLGFGALMGDAIESFFKRRRGIAAGDSWFPFDQIDYIIGGLLLVYPSVHLPLWALATILLVYFGLHLLVAYCGFLLGLKHKPI
ncbi:MAG TPA: CDP-archaeol synthase [Candidatus Saccharimonadales bacterium]|nr:CDP-archaeol synthase [Candidatus Saccharimonadales bacterium]